MAVSFGGWIKLFVAISAFGLLAGCSFGELPPLTDLSDEDDASVISDVLDSTFYDAHTTRRDTGETDSGAPDTHHDSGLVALDASGQLDSGLDVIEYDAAVADVNAPEPDVKLPEQDVNPSVPCARVKVAHASETTIRAGARNSASSLGVLRKNSVVVARAGVYGESVGGSKVWYQIESPSGNGYIPSGHVECTQDAPHIEPPPLSEVCPNVKVIAGQGVNIRHTPDGSGYAGGLCHGSIVQVIARVKGKLVEGDDTWYQITSPTANGFIAGKYAECTKSPTRLTTC